MFNGLKVFNIKISILSFQKDEDTESVATFIQTRSLMHFLITVFTN